MDSQRSANLASPFTSTSQWETIGYRRLCRSRGLPEANRVGRVVPGGFELRMRAATTISPRSDLFWRSLLYDDDDDDWPWWSFLILNFLTLEFSAVAAATNFPSRWGHRDHRKAYPRDTENPWMDLGIVRYLSKMLGSAWDFWNFWSDKSGGKTWVELNVKTRPQHAY